MVATHFGMTSIDTSKQELVESTLSKFLLAEDLDPMIKDNYIAFLAVKTDPRNSSVMDMTDSGEYQVIMMVSNTTPDFKRRSFDTSMKTVQDRVAGKIDVQVITNLINFLVKTI